MKEYYIHEDGSQIGPFLLHELVKLELTWHTMIWSPVAQAWLPAYRIEGLQKLPNVAPPPLMTRHGVTASAGPAQYGYEEPTAMGNYSVTLPKKKNTRTIAVTVVVLALLIGGGMLYGVPNVKGDAYAREVRRQNALIEEQNTKLKEYNRLESARQAEIREQKLAEERKRRAKEIRVINEQYDAVLAELAAEQEKLEDIKSFHFLRTPEEKQEQVQAQLQVIKGKQMEVNVFKKALAKY